MSAMRTEYQTAHSSIFHFKKSDKIVKILILIIHVQIELTWLNWTCWSEPNTASPAEQFSQERYPKYNFCNGKKSISVTFFENFLIHLWKVWYTSAHLPEEQRMRPRTSWRTWPREGRQTGWKVPAIWTGESRNHKRCSYLEIIYSFSASVTTTSNMTQI